MALQTPRQMFADALRKVMAAKNMDEHQMCVGYAMGVCDTLCIGEVIDQDTYSKYMDELVALIQAQKAICIAQGG